MKFVDENLYLNYTELYTNKNTAAMEKLDAQEKAYSEYFNTVICPAFSKAFVTQYQRCSGFHDWEILALTQEQTPRGGVQVRAKLFADHLGKEKCLVYKKVKKFTASFDFDHFKDMLYDNLSTDEFLKIDDKTFSHEVWFAGGSHYYVEFEKIVIV